MSDTLLPAYRHRLVAAGYDALNTLLWLPTGSRRLRRMFVEAVDVGPDCRVLELGCGTGLVTSLLCATGASVTAIDNADTMIAAARRRAPSAVFVRGNAVAPAVTDPFDRIVLGFVLHELTPDERVTTLINAARWLTPTGTIGILEWACPPSALGRVWRAIVGAIEPSVALDVLGGGLDAAIELAGLDVITDTRCAAGRARIVVTKMRVRG